MVRRCDNRGGYAVRAEPAFIDIVEAQKALTVEGTGGYIKPDEVRINGVAVAMPRGATVFIHDIAEDDVPTVTLTLFARRIVIGHKDDVSCASPNPVACCCRGRH